MARKSMLLGVAMLGLAMGLAHAQGTTTGGSAKAEKSASAAHKASGVVKAVDHAKSSVMVAHDPVKSLNWPAMTMPFLVKDHALMGKLQPGKKVEFEFVQQGKDYVITTVR